MSLCNVGVLWGFVAKRLDGLRCHLVRIMLAWPRRLGRGDSVLGTPKQGGGTASPQFWPTSTVAKRLDGSR